MAVFAFAATGHADELSDIQAQSKQLRDQNQALMKRLSDLEKRQQKLEKQPAQAAAPRVPWSRSCSPSLTGRSPRPSGASAR